MKFIFFALLSFTQLWSSPTPPPPILPNQPWSLPPLGWVKLNFASTADGVAGCLARSSEGVFLGGWAERCHSSGEVAEACAARLACMAATGFSGRVVLEGDAGHGVVDAINGVSGGSWETHVFVHDCVQVLGELSSFSIVSVDGSSNGAAHIWADWAQGNEFQGFLAGDDLSLLVRGLDDVA